VVLMGVIAFNPMLRAGYDVKLASGVITAGGTLGIPHSAFGHDHRLRGGGRAVGRQALRGRDVPGFFLSFLYLVYIIGWAMINPKIAPPLPEEQSSVPVPDWLRKFAGAYSRNMCRARVRAVLAVDGDCDRSRRQGASGTGCCSKNFASHWCRSSDRRHALADLVVRRHPPAGRRRSRVSGVQQLGTPGLRRRGKRLPSKGRRRLSICGSAHRG
jgi:TRAP-type mannitol/chloroaromatic compound transport system permease large subunit